MMMHTGTRRQRGFTLIEMMLALIVTGLVMSAVVSMLTAVSYGTSSNLDLRGLLVGSKTLDARISAAIRSCREVKTDEMSAGSSFVILWVSDDNNDGNKDNAEMRLIDFDSATGKINDHYSAAAAGVYANVANLRGLVTPQAWATGVTSCTFDANTTGAKTLVSRKVTLAAADVSETTVGATSVRN